MNRVLPGLNPTDPNDRGRWACMDCDANTWGEYFMVHHVLWHQAVGHRAGKLCVTCLEARLGRLLDADDFIACPANDPDWRKSDRLRERMARRT